MADEQNQKVRLRPLQEGQQNRLSRLQRRRRPLHRSPRLLLLTRHQTPSADGGYPLEGELPAQLKERFGGDIAECASYLGQNFAVVKADALIPVIEYLKLEADFEYLWISQRSIIQTRRALRSGYVLYSFSRNERMRVKANIADGAQPQPP